MQVRQMALLSSVITAGGIFIRSYTPFLHSLPFFIFNHLLLPTVPVIVLKNWWHITETQQHNGGNGGNLYRVLPTNCTYAVESQVRME